MCSDGRYTSIYECYESCRRNVPRDGRRRKTRRHWSEPTKFDHFYLLYCELDRRLLSVAVSIDGEWIIYCLARNYRREHGGAVRTPQLPPKLCSCPKQNLLDNFLTSFATNLPQNIASCSLWSRGSTERRTEKQAVSDENNDYSLLIIRT